MFLYGKVSLFYVLSPIVYVGGIYVAHRTKFYGEGLKILALIIFSVPDVAHYFFLSNRTRIDLDVAYNHPSFSLLLHLLAHVLVDNSNSR